jgi:hypothetical protein
MNMIHIDMVMGHDARDILDRLDSVAEAAKRIIFPDGVWYCDLVRAELRHREGDRMGAIEEYKRCLELFRSTHVWGTCACLVHLSDAYLEEQDLDEAFRWVVVYLAQSRSTGIVHTVQALRRIGDVFAARGDEDTAANIYAMGLEAFTGMGVHCGRAECMVRLGMVARGDTAMARQLWIDARELFEEMGQGLAAAEVDKQLIYLSDVI